MSTFASPQIGVYRIVHRDSARFYVGSSKQLSVRFVQHFNHLQAERHHARHLQHCWSKYGPEAFDFEVVLNCVTWADALDAEQAFLDEFYKTPLCMNASGKAHMPILDPDVMARARATANASVRYQESHRAVCVARNSDPAFQIRATAALRVSARHKAATSHNARTVLQDPEVYARNRLALKNSTAQKAAALAQAMRLNSDPESRARNLAATSKAVVGVHVETGEVLTFASQSAAARAVGVCSSNISMCCAGKLQTVKGYRWTVP